MEEGRSRFKVDIGRPLRRHNPENHTQTEAAESASAAHHEPAKTEHHKPKKLGFFYGRRWLLVVIILLVAGVAALTYGYIHTKNELNKAKNPTTAGKTEAEQIVNTINKVVLVPTGETPTLATVQDVSKLKSQTFFKNAQNGDKVLIYSRSGQAILYRPLTKQVIEYAPVNLGANQ